MEKIFYPLSAITKRIGTLLQPAITTKFWVKAEISSGRERGGAFYCDLTESDHGKIIAKIPCTIWQRELTCIRSLFKENGMEFNPTDGMTIGFLCTVQYSSQYGLSLKVIDADPMIAMGAMELKKREIIARIQQEGLFLKNKELQTPLLPQRIGLITSAGSAACNDIIKTLADSGFGFKVYLADSMMQGEQTEKSVLLAIDTLCAIRTEIIIIARGGGSKMDLYFLDNENIARRIASCRIPVWTGIGHEIDTSVLDYVAGKSFKTPTALAEDLVARHVQMKRQLEESGSTLKSVWAYRLEKQQEFIEKAFTKIQQAPKKRIETASSRLRDQVNCMRLKLKKRLLSAQIHIQVSMEKLQSGTRSAIQSRRSKLSPVKSMILTAAKNRLAVERKTIEGKMSTIKASDPQHAFQRGYAIIYNADGHAVKSIKDVDIQQVIRAKVSDGIITGQITRKEQTADYGRNHTGQQ